MADTLKRPTDYKLKKINVLPEYGARDPIDITPIFLEMHIYEDLYKPFVTGTILVTDTQGVIPKTPITGEEYLEIEIDTPGADDPYEKKFAIYRVDGRTSSPTGNTMQQYVLHFCSLEAQKNAKTTVSMGFAGKLLSDMVTTVYDQYLKVEDDLDVEPTLLPQQIVIPNWKPARFMMYCAARAQSAKYPTGADYAFWQDRDGFHFRSLQSLIDEIEPKKDSEQREMIRWKPANTSDNDPGLAMHAMEEFRFPEAVDSLARMMDGTLASRIISFDPIQGGVKVIDSLAQDLISQIKTLEAPNLPFSAAHAGQLADPQANIRLFVSDASEQFKSNMEEFRPLQVMQSALMRNSLIDITLPGNSARRIGHVVKLDMPVFEPTAVEGKEPDRFVSGNAMIMAINHSFTKSEFKQHIQLAKDTYFEEVKEYDG